MRLLFFSIALLVVIPVRGELLQQIVIREDDEAVGDVVHSEYTGSYTRIDATRLQRGGQSLASVIADEPGVQFREAGGQGSFTRVSIRAASSAQTSVYLDGVLLNNAATGGVDLSQYELLNVGSIDIYRAATPIQLGVGSIGGAINLRSPTNSGGMTRLLAGTGSFAGSRLQFARQLTKQNWDSTLLVSRQASDNDFLFTESNGTPLNPTDDRRERRVNSAFERNALFFKVGRQLQAERRIDASLQFAKRDQGVPHWRNRSDNRATYSTESLQFQLNHRTFAGEDARWNHTESLYVNRDGEQYDDRLSQIGLGAQLSDTDIDILGLRSYWDYPAEHGTTALDIDVRQESVAHTDLLGAADYNARRRRLNLALQYSYFLFDDRLLLTPALRHVNLHDEFNGVTRAGSNTWQSSKSSAQLGLKWRQSDTLSFSANLGQHHREPTFFELFGDRGLVLGNNTLAAEKGINADVGMEWRWSDDRRLGISLFSSQRDQLIVTAYDARGIGRSENSGKARITGLESYLHWSFSQRWQAQLNLTLQNAENRAAFAAYNGKQLPGEARVAGHARLRYQRNNWRFWYESDLLRDRYYDLSNALPADDQWLHHVGIGFSYRQLSASLSIRNIGDDNVQDFNGFSKPGRSFHLQFNYTITGDPGANY